MVNLSIKYDDPLGSITRKLVIENNEIICLFAKCSVSM
jgi:hypothetical protein